MSEFAINPQLLADCHRLGRFEFCHVLLNKNAALPWFILVPETAVADLLDLPEAQRTVALSEAAVIAQLIKRHLGYLKINFAAIGNVVPQLHLHIVGRKPAIPAGRRRCGVILSSRENIQISVLSRCVSCWCVTARSRWKLDDSKAPCRNGQELIQRSGSTVMLLRSDDSRRKSLSADNHRGDEGFDQSGGEQHGYDDDAEEAYGSA